MDANIQEITQRTRNKVMANSTGRTEGFTKGTGTTESSTDKDSTRVLTVWRGQENGTTAKNYDGQTKIDLNK